MAFDVSKIFANLNFFNRLDARSRVIFLLGGVMAFVILVYIGTRFFWGGERKGGGTSLATAPAGAQSRPGAQTSAEYRALIMQSDIANRQQAQSTGGSAIATQLYQAGTQSGSCVICSDQSANVKDDLNTWLSQGAIGQDAANYLQSLADKNVPVSEYAADLDRLVREGKLTPEQARLLLEKYRKQHTNQMLGNSEKMMDDLIKSGDLPLDAAVQLLNAQKNGVSPTDYAAQLQQLVREGKISPELAQRLLAQYTQQRAKEVIAQSIASLRKMAREGQITPDVEKQLIELENKMVPLDLYASTLNTLLSQNKITPAVSAKILAEFKDQKAAIGPTGSLNQYVQQAEQAAYNELEELLKAGKITQEIAQQIAILIQKNISFDGFQAFINQLVAQKKLTPDIAKLKIADYKIVKGLRDEMGVLNNLQANNVNADNYADELKKAVQAGILTPEQAKQLLQEYQAMLSRTTASRVGVTGNSDFARLQQKALESTASSPTTETQSKQFEIAATKVQQESDQDRAARIQNLMTAMNGQAQQLISVWQPTTIEHRVGETPVSKKVTETTTTQTSGSGSLNGNATQGASLIKAGTILFAVLDTGVNSDYPDSPILATIVEGKFKGAKLLGKMVISTSISGQMDRVALNFTLMDMEDWPKSKTITAYAIDPDTGRSVMASDVNYHYLLRYGSVMATSFMQGYSSSITNAGTSTTGIFGTSTTHPNLSPASKIAVALGQVGQNLGSATQNYFNTPPTVKVDSGVGLGILFMAEVTE